ncbi:MAG: sulfite exporter TauE/SafE family protein [Planctomycetes bacterium]|nr:sulfite exporter TauE/SafE family protein [Planctomycetota bacterium]
MADLPYPVVLTLAILAGVAAGFINTLAGSGSLLTLPALMALGLSLQVANGTNRVGILVASLVSVITMARSHAIPRRSAGTLAALLVPAAIGAWFGSRAAIDLPDDVVDRVVGGLMVVLLATVLLRPERWIVAANEAPVRVIAPLPMVVMAAIGFYGGFIQAGVGLFLLFALVPYLRFGLKEANALKLLVVLVFTVPALIEFERADQVDWPLGLVLAGGQTIGALIAARVATKSPRADAIIRALLVVVLAATAIDLLVR